MKRRKKSHTHTYRTNENVTKNKVRRETAKMSFKRKLMSMEVTKSQNFLLSYIYKGKYNEKEKLQCIYIPKCISKKKKRTKIGRLKKKKKSL